MRKYIPIRELRKMNAMERLRKRRSALMAELSGSEGMVRGSIVETRKKCGRPDCECARGRLHPHRYLSTGGKGRNRIVYVSDAEKAAFSRGVAAYDRAWKLICRISEINIRLIKEGWYNE